MIKHFKAAIGRLDNVRWRTVFWKMLVTFGEGVIATMTAGALTEFDANALNAALLGGLAAAASLAYNVVSQLWKGTGEYIEPERAVVVTGRDLTVEVKDPNA